MQIALDLASPVLANPAAFAWVVRLCLAGVVTINRATLRAYRGQIPPLYRAGVRYRSEPPDRDTFADLWRTWKRGHGDCAHLACWRVAELREAGEPATLRVTWRVTPTRRAFHVVVRRARGRKDDFEDPSRLLGMGRNAA